MPVNPITLDKMEPIVIKHIEMKTVDRIVHEIKGAEIQKEKKDEQRDKAFNKEKQEHAAKQFGYILAKHNLKFEYKVLKDRIKVKVKDQNGNTILDTEIEDMENLLANVKREQGGIIDVRG